MSSIAGNYFKTCTFALLIISSCLVWNFDAVADEELPRWEVGIGGGVASIPQYMGSDERYTIAVPLPFIIYRGKALILIATVCGPICLVLTSCLLMPV